MFLIVCTLFTSLVFGLAIPVNDVDIKWEQFQSQFDRLYEDPEELEARKMIFMQNLEEIIRHNADFEAGLASYQKGINQFSDRTEAELKSLLGLPIQSLIDLHQHNAHKVDFLNAYNADIPESIDYRKDGAVTPVKNQKHCRSCWAFAAVGAIESSYFLKAKKLVSFSEQQLVDCSKRNYGCSGGWVEKAFEDLQKMAGIASSESYAYSGRKESCKINTAQIFAKIEGYKTFDKSPTALKKALVKYGPISVALEATPAMWQYQKDVFAAIDCEGHPNHAMLLVGYGSENGTDYWLVKNSWGTNWGDQGYIRLNSDETRNCIHLSLPSVPIVKPIV